MARADLGRRGCAAVAGQRDDRRRGPGARRRGGRGGRGGLRRVKVKVGIGDDAGRVAAVRAAVGPTRGDPGRTPTAPGQTPSEALANLRALAPVGLELCEEPVHGVEALRAVRGGVAGADRDGRDRGRARRRRLRRGRRRVPEDRPLRRASRGCCATPARRARPASNVYVASTFDGPLGIAAGLHAAAGLRASGPVAYCGLATLSAFEEYEGVLEPVDGRRRGAVRARACSASGG